MQIGYSPETLRSMMLKNAQDVESEAKWLIHYIHAPIEIECVEDCVRNIMDSCTALLEHIENFKGEEM